MAAYLRVSLVLLFLGWGIAGCGALKQTSSPGYSRPQAHSKSQPPHSSDSTDSFSMITVRAVNGSDSSLKPVPIQKDRIKYTTADKSTYLLHQAYQKWEETPYQWGGTTIHGIDCSMFVNTVFKEYFNIDLPRRTYEQMSAGKGVRRKSIQTGDLIFFRTGRRTLHVGIALNDKKFMHASTSEGVTISRLKKKYWANRYLTARRIL